MKKILFALAILLTGVWSAAQQPLNNDAIIKMVKGGLSDDLIVTTITSSPGNYDISPDGMIALKSAGVSDKVVAAMVHKANATIKQPAQATSSQSQPNMNSPISDQQTSITSDNSQNQPNNTDSGSSNGSKPIHAGSRVVIAPMGGFETYFAAAVREKKVPIILTLDKSSADFFVVSTNTEWQGFVFGSGGSKNWTPNGGSSNYGAYGSSTRGLEASIMLIDAKSKDVVWAYEVHKNSHGSILFGTLGARGQQSIAEACAKHLKEYIEKGK